MKTLFDGTEVEDNVPTRSTSEGRYALTPDELLALDTDVVQHEKKVKIKEDAESLTAYSKDRLNAYIEAGATLEGVLEALWEKTMEGRPEKADAMELKRQEIKLLFPKTITKDK